MDATSPYPVSAFILVALNDHMVAFAQVSRESAVRICVVLWEQQKVQQLVVRLCFRVLRARYAILLLSHHRLHTTPS